MNPLKIDDAYVGILALKAGIDVTYVRAFRMNENCKYNNNTIVHHPVSSAKCMDELYQANLASFNLSRII